MAGVVRGTPRAACQGKLIPSHLVAPLTTMTIAPKTDALPGWLISVFGQMFGASQASRYGVERERFDSILLAVMRKYLPLSSLSDKEESCTFLKSLHVQELVLARACAAGNDAAWQDFILQFRETLYSAARSIAGEESSSRELADSLYADLYGTVTRQGERVSKLDSYTGRGSLAGWLRTVLAQEHVNRYRKHRRTVSLEEKTDAGVQFAAPVKEESPAPDGRVVCAMDQALAGLGAEDRLILIHYYLEGRTLAEVGRMLGVHESTISRKTDKIVQRLRRAIRDQLLHSGMSRRQVEEALAVDVRDLTIDFQKALSRKNASAAQLSTGEGGGRRSTTRPASSSPAEASQPGGAEVVEPAANLPQDLRSQTFQAREGEE